MKIGFVFDDSLDRPDGVQQYVLALGQWLRHNGHEVYYLVGQTSRTDITGVYSLGKTVRVHFNGNVIGTPLPVRKSDISKLLGTLNLDILHVQLPYSPVLAGRAVQVASLHTAVVGTLHIYPSSSLEQTLNRALTLVNTKTLARFDKIVAVSNVAAEASHLPNKEMIDVIPNPVDIKRFQPVIPNSKPGNKIVFLGRLVPRKGCMRLLRAINQLVKQQKYVNGWTVEIGGIGPLQARLEAFVKQNNLQKVVSFKGFIHETDKPLFLYSADIAVFPSTGGESFGIVLLEAMASGAMVMAGKNPGYACVLGKGSPQLFSTNNVDQLSEMLEEAMASNSIRRKIIKQQAELVKSYDIQLVGQQIEAVYKKALHSRVKMG